MADPPAEEVILHVQEETVALVGGRPPRDLLGQLGDDDLIGVDDQDPFVAEREVLQGPVLLLGVDAVEVERHDSRAMLRRDGRGGVAALAIDDEDLVGPGERGEASAQVGLLVLHRHEHAHPDLRGRGGSGGLEVSPSRDHGLRPDLRECRFRLTHRDSPLLGDGSIPFKG
jgi:hypothetical protein